MLLCYYYAAIVSMLIYVFDICYRFSCFTLRAILICRHACLILCHDIVFRAAAIIIIRYTLTIRHAFPVIFAVLLLA